MDLSSLSLALSSANNAEPKRPPKSQRPRRFPMNGALRRRLRKPYDGPEIDEALARDVESSKAQTIRWMNDSENYNAPTMGHLSEGRMDKKISDIEKDSSYYEKHVRNWRTDEPNWVPRDEPLNPPMHWHPETVYPVEFKKFYDFITTNYDRLHKNREMKADLDKLISIWTAFNSLGLLQRFLSTKQRVLQSQPLPDGSNIPPGQEYTSLRLEWEARRRWIRTLHLPGLIGPTSSSTRASLYAKFYELSRLLLEDEVTHLYPAATDPSFWNSKAEIDPAYYVFLGDSTMRNVEKYIWKALGDATAKAIPIGSMESNLTDDKLPRIIKSISKGYHQAMQKYPTHHLLMDLVIRENAFEMRLADEHVEDTLIDKRILPYDELDYLTNWRYLKRHLAMRELLEKYDGDAEEVELVEEYVKKITRAIGDVYRQRSNFRQVRDYSDRRPWWKIHQLYETIDNPPLAEAITHFCNLFYSFFDNNILDEERQQSVRAKYHTHPILHSDKIFAGHKRVALGLFGVHPVDIRNTRELYTDWGTNDVLKHTCILCKQGYVGASWDVPGNWKSTAMLLRCHHFMHLKCIMDFWDEDGRYVHECPECGEVSEMSFASVGIKPGHSEKIYDTESPSFLYNVWDYEPPPLDTTARTRALKRRRTHLYTHRRVLEDPYEELPSPTAPFDPLPDDPRDLPPVRGFERADVFNVPPDPHPSNGPRLREARLPGRRDVMDGLPIASQYWLLENLAEVRRAERERERGEGGEGGRRVAVAEQMAVLRGARRRRNKWRREKGGRDVRGF